MLEAVAGQSYTVISSPAISILYTWLPLHNAGPALFCEGLHSFLILLDFIMPWQVILEILKLDTKTV